MRIEVLLALPAIQHCVALDLPDGATVADAIAASGLDTTGVHDEHVGIWNRRVTLATPLRDADRVEIYRPLVADPQRARRARAAVHPVGGQAKRRISRS
jgi:putative ubiquitin-RnfH superfamily antitoxin RatB of RatAB toxin-antitoxin module